MSHHDAGTSALASEPWICARCGCQQTRACRIEIIVTRPNGQRAMLLADECDWSAPGLCTACDERLLPELKSLLDIWRQLGPIAMAFRVSDESTEATRVSESAEAIGICTPAGQTTVH